MVIALVGDPNPRSLQSAFISNKTSISLARRELADFPEGIVIEIRDLAGDRIQSVRLEHALTLDASNRTALHRLGLMALRKGDYEDAAIFLEKAARLDSEHPGIVKALGFTYVWLGDFERAYVLLNRFSGVSNELEGYAHWWSKIGRPDLATNALAMVAKISD
jgi:tetratricopeptide (TPR) repeat protein